MNESKGTMSRREFLNATVAGAALLASGTVVTASAKDTAKTSAPDQQKIFVCSVCGHVEFGGAPESCPVCNAEEKFSPGNWIFSDAIAKAKDESAAHTPIIAVLKKSTLVADVPCKEVDIRVGKTMHPVEEKNHIHFIDFYLDDRFFTRFPTSPHLYPAVSLFLKDSKARFRAIAFCSMHGYWQAEAQL